MVEKEVDYSTIRIKNDLRKELDSYKVEAESYSVVIAKLIEENSKLKEDVEFLKEDRIKLYELALGTENSVALINNIHKATYFIALVVNDVTSTEEEKLQQLKTYLKEMLEKYPSDVMATIRNLKEMLELEEVPVPEVLIQFENYVVENYSSWCYFRKEFFLIILSDVNF